MEDKRDIRAMWLNGTMGSIEDCCARIQELDDWNQQVIAGLRNQIKDLKDIHYKDKDIQQMQKEVADMKANYYRGFPLSEAENDAVNEWIKQHTDTYHNGNMYAGVNGGNWKYEFIPTSIGTVKHCYCESCLRKAQHTAYANQEDWTDREVADKYIKLFDASIDFSVWA